MKRGLEAESGVESEKKQDTPAALTFVTGNAGKLREVSAMLGTKVNLVSMAVDLPELQGECEEIAIQKCKLAYKQLNKPCLIEDTSLCFNALGGLPGPYIKWFLEKTGLAGLNNMLAAYEDKSAYAQTIFALALDAEQPPLLFVGRCPGKIVPPREKYSFNAVSWDPVFQPDGFELTFSEMTHEQKNTLSHRFFATQKLKEYLEKHPIP